MLEDETYGSHRYSSDLSFADFSDCLRLLCILCLRTLATHSYSSCSFYHRRFRDDADYYGDDFYDDYCYCY